MVAGWLAAAVSAVVIGVIAVSLLGNSITDSSQAAMNQDDVEEQLTGSPGPSGATAASEPSESPSATSDAPADPSSDSTTDTARETTTATPGDASAEAGEPRGIGSIGGQVVAVCRGNDAFLESWSPAQGFVVDDIERGPDDDASVTFESGEREVEIDVECRGGVPVADIEVDD